MCLVFTIIVFLLVTCYYYCQSSPGQVQCLPVLGRCSEVSGQSRPGQAGRAEHSKILVCCASQLSVSSRLWRAQRSATVQPIQPRMKMGWFYRGKLSTPAYSRLSGGTSTGRFAGTLTSKTWWWWWWWWWVVCMCETLDNSTEYWVVSSPYTTCQHCICFTLPLKITTSCFFYCTQFLAQLSQQWHWFYSMQDHINCKLPQRFYGRNPLKNPVLLWSIITLSLYLTSSLWRH